EEILRAQKELITMMGELATSPGDLERYRKDGFEITTSSMVGRVTGVIDELEKDKSLYPKDWVIPGASVASAALDNARTTCRRAERRVAALVNDDKNFNIEILRYSIHQRNHRHRPDDPFLAPVAHTSATFRLCRRS